MGSNIRYYKVLDHVNQMTLHPMAVHFEVNEDNELQATARDLLGNKMIFEVMEVTATCGPAPIDTSVFSFESKGG